jgi:hypothetical protein
MKDDPTRSEETDRRRVLVVVTGETTRSIALPETGALVIGRAEDADVRLELPSVSRRHARLHVGRELAIEDLGGKNRTRVTGTPLASGARAALRAGHVFECGEAILVVRDGDAGGARSLASFVLSRDGRWLEDAHGDRVTLGRRGALRRMLLALVARRVDEPGRATSVAELVEAGWPGDRARFDSAQARVYTSVQRLRALGLAGVLVTRDDGYLLDPDVPFAWAAL